MTHARKTAFHGVASLILASIAAACADAGREPGAAGTSGDSATGITIRTTPQ